MAKANWRRAAALGLFGLCATADSGPPIKVGLIGLDTSHAVAFTSVLNDPKATGETAGFRVVAAFPGGSADIPSSRDRVGDYTRQLQTKYGVEMVDSIDQLVSRVDVVMIESIDGRPHLQQAIPVVKAHKRLFIDKPVAGSLADAQAIYLLAEREKVPVFSSSALRFAKGVASAGHDPKVGAVVGCFVYSPCSLDERHPDLFWYGIHGVEMLYTVMGPACQSVTRTTTIGTDVVTGVWRDGRVGTFRGIRDGKGDYGGTVFGAKAVGSIGGFTGYEPLVVEICRFFKTGKSPVDAATTLELYAFMEAADESKRRGGAPASIPAVAAAAKQKAIARLAALPVDR